MISLQIRIEESLRDKAQAVAHGMGIDLSSAVRLFLTQMVRENGLPFQPKADPFFSPQNQTHLQAVVDDLRHGRNCAPHELIGE